MSEPTCRICGCTEARACIAQVRPLPHAPVFGMPNHARVMTCCWVEPDLCSACAEETAGNDARWVRPSQPDYDERAQALLAGAR